MVRLKWQDALKGDGEELKAALKEAGETFNGDKKVLKVD